MAFHLEHAGHIERPAAEISSFLVDLRNQMHWYEGMKSVRMIEGVPGTVGSRCEVVFDALGREFKGIETIVAYEPSKRIVMESDQGPVMVRWTGTLAPEGSGTRVVFAFDVHTGGVARLFAGKIRGAMGAAIPSNMEALRKLLEGKPAVAPTSAAPA